MGDLQQNQQSKSPHEAEKKRRIPCNFPGCEKSFLRSEHLSRHQLNHYERTLKCGQCGKTFARSDLLHRHVDRHRSQQQKIHTANAQPPQNNPPSAVRSQSSPYPTSQHRPHRSLSADTVPRSVLRDPPPNLMHTQYIASPVSHSLLPSPSHNSSLLQQCLSPLHPGMPVVQPLGVHHDYTLQQTMFTTDMHHHPHNPNSPMNAPGLIVPASPNPSSVFEMNAKWDHLFQGGGIFELSSFLGAESEYGNLTPPSVSLETMTSNISPYQGYISAPIAANANDFVVSQGTIERLRSELPEIYRPSRFVSSGYELAGLLQKAFFHIHNNFPIFHRPTLQLDELPTYLILAIASFGGLLSDDAESQHFGLTLHNHVRDFVFSPTIFSQNRELWMLQTMLLLNISGGQLGKRLDHDMSDILQGTMVTLARRNSFMFEENSQSLGKLHATDEFKWHDWIRHESIKRFAHFIFINDTQNTCIYGHHPAMSIWEMRLAMPCSDSLWNASSSQEWRRVMTEERKSRSQEFVPTTLLDIVNSFAAPNSTGTEIDPRTVRLDGLGLYAVVHGIFSMAWQNKHRKRPLPYPSVKMETPAEPEDILWLLQALQLWKSRFDHFWSGARYPHNYQPTSTTWSPPFRLAASAIYDLCWIWIEAPLSDIQIAAGSRFAHSRMMNKQRAQQSWIKMNKKTLSDDVCGHALNLVEAELFYKTENGGPHSYLSDPAYPLFMPYVAYLGGLALWAYTHNLERQPSFQLPNPSTSTFGVDSFGMTEYPRMNPLQISTPSQLPFSESDDHNSIISILRGHLTLSQSSNHPSQSAYYQKSPLPSNANPAFRLSDPPGKTNLFKHGTDVLLGYLKEQLHGHRWEIAMEGFEILQGTGNRGDYQ